MKTNGTNNTSEEHTMSDLLQQVSKSAEVALLKVMQDAMSGYDSPLRKFAANAVERRSGELMRVFDKAMSDLLNDAEFQAELEGALRRKLAQLLVSSQTGEVEKIFNQIKADPIRRANMTHMIARIASEI